MAEVQEPPELQKTRPTDLHSLSNHTGLFIVVFRKPEKTASVQYLALKLGRAVKKGSEEAKFHRSVKHDMPPFQQALDLLWDLANG